jgi:NAD(P)-dependent dehydrogenase (short-subunit alcohol dehydrogenase family)
MKREPIEEAGVVVITGAFRGIGHTIFRHLVKSHIVWPVVRTPNQKRKIQETLTNTHPKTFVFYGDIRLPETVQKISAAIKKNNVQLYSIIHCAGPIVYSNDNIPEWRIWKQQVGDNLAPSVFLIQNLTPEMKKGRIILFGFSGMGILKGFKNISAYAAAKETVAVLARSAAKKLASKNITVNVIAPGVFLDERGNIPRYGNTMLPMIPTGRFGTSEDICGVIDWLLSSQSSYVTGQIIKVSGGLHIS